MVGYLVRKKHNPSIKGSISFSSEGESSSSDNDEVTSLKLDKLYKTIAYYLNL